MKIYLKSLKPTLIFSVNLVQSYHYDESLSLCHLGQCGYISFLELKVLNKTCVLYSL